MLTCVKRGPRRGDVVKVCGAGEFLCRYDWLKCYLARSHIEKHVLGTGSTRPRTAILDVHNEIFFKAVAAGELVPTKIGTYFSVVTKVRENAPDKANDWKLVSRQPQELFGPEREF